jgi:peptidoglycan/xylan/chitin deacetylase (PgdA/CDA1 family)
MTTSRITSAVALVATLVFASCGHSASNATRTRHTPVPILMYHVIEQAPAGAPYSQLYVSEPDFAAQMRWLQRNGYQAVTQRDVWAHWHRGAALPRKAVVISFDDGYRSVAQAALPHLRSRSWPGVLNLTVKNLRVSGGLTDFDVRTLISSGWELASHTLTHPDLTTLDDAELTREVASSRKALRARFRVPIDFFCYPSGRFDDRVIRSVRRAGYLGATTTIEGLARPGQPYELRRIRVSAGDGVAGLARKLGVPQPTSSVEASGPVSGTSTPAPRRPTAAESYAYRWPVKPFDRQHPVRGFFGDPRIANHGESRQFHFGIDISAPNGTPVYATLTGRAYIHPLHDTTILVVAGSTEFSYWHVVPAIRSGQRVVAYRTVIGHIEAPYEHVHFSERQSGRYLNPLRRGALGPYSDATTPLVRSAVLDPDGSLVGEAYDETPIAVPRPWHDLPVMPAVVRWRLVGKHGKVVIGWRTTVDFRLTIPDASEFDRIWAHGVSQNHVRVPGRYRLTLAGASELRSLHAGSYVVEMAVSDTRANASRARIPLTLSDA